MIIIDMVKEASNSKKVKVILDDGSFYHLYYGEIKRLGLKKDKEVTAEVFGQIQELLYKRGLTYCYHLLGKKDYTVFELTSKLRKAAYIDAVIDAIMIRLEEMRLVDDVAYTQRYIRTYIGHKGIKWIKNKLYQKGITEISDNLVQELEDSGYGSQLEAVHKALRKWVGSKDQENLDVAKLTNHLLRKGFEYESVSQAIKAYEEGEDLIF